MRVFVAGATGALGRPLLRALIEAGHDVTGTTRSPERAAALREQGATPVVLDALDADAVHAAVAAAEPEVVVHHLTAIPEAIPPRRYAQAFETTNRLRREATPVLVDAARTAGARRILVESVSFVLEPKGPPVAEEGPVWADAPKPFTDVFASVDSMERAVLDAPGIEGLVLRYGFLYGPGTGLAPDGGIAAMIRRRQFPIVGSGAGLWSFLHVDDAADATVLALDHGSPGVYNITDDDPAAVRDWLPVAAEALGAGRPRRVPALVGRLAAGRVATHPAIHQRGNANAKARRELGFRPRPWRVGLPAALRA